MGKKERRIYLQAIVRRYQRASRAEKASYWMITDNLTTWTENRATWGKGSIGVLNQIKDIEQKNWSHVR